MEPSFNSSKRQQSHQSLHSTMVKVPTFITTLLLASSTLLVTATSPSSSTKISLKELLLDQPTNLHKHLRDSHGVLRITVNDEPTQQRHGLKAVRKRALSHLCSCPTFNDDTTSDSSSLFQQVLQSHPKDVQQINLPDGTVRRTLASATVGFDDNHNDNDAAVLELPSWIKDKCGEEAYDSLEELRDVVARVTDAFVAKLDEEQQGDDGFEVVGRGVKNYESYRSVLADANHLEHFHVYTKAGEENDANVAEAGDTMDGIDRSTPTLDYHTDAGFFLSFVPAMDCHTFKTDDSSFYLKGETKPLKFEEDEVVILMGAGAQYWLSEEENNEQHTFMAAPHALRLKSNTHRSWYGKMHLLPSSMQAKALTNPPSTKNAKYGDVLPDLKFENYKAHVPTSPVDGCGTTIFESSPFDDEKVAPSFYTRTNRRRLQHVNSPANCNNVTNFFCWHQCIGIPNSDYVEDYVRDGYSLYCLDPSIMVSTDNSIPDATGPCKGGYAHNANCVGSWQGTDESVAGYEFPGLKQKLAKEAQEIEETESYPVPEEFEEQYCYGGTSMYMDGFHWQDSTCVILLFPSWVLSTPGKFGLACFGSILFGIVLELVLYKRRSVYALPAGFRRLILSAFVYGAQLTMGYFIMLIVMTYSGPLLLSCIIGMVIGHVMFNAQDALVKKYGDDVKKKEQRNGSPLRNGSTLRNSSELRSYQNGGRTSESDYEVENGGSPTPLSETQSLTPSETTTLKHQSSVRPSGATPCCQYTMEDSGDNSFMD